MYAKNTMKESYTMSRPYNSKKNKWQYTRRRLMGWNFCKGTQRFRTRHTKISNREEQTICSRGIHQNVKFT
jgi:hypothetical protein